MEEKERYIIGKGEDIFIADNDRKVMFTITTKKLQDLLNQQDTKISDLEAKLAEKEKECKDNLHHAEFWQSAYKRCVDRENQDKISFAVERLEKVKDIILNERKITSFNFDIFNKGKDTALFWLNEQIDNQINELKGKVEDVKD